MELIRWPELQKKLGGFSRLTLWRWEKEGSFPNRIRLAGGSVAWLVPEVDEWIEQRGRERGND